MPVTADALGDALNVPAVTAAPHSDGHTGPPYDAETDSSAPALHTKDGKQAAFAVTAGADTQPPPPVPAARTNSSPGPHKTQPGADAGAHADSDGDHTRPPEQRACRVTPTAAATIAPALAVATWGLTKRRLDSLGEADRVDDTLALCMLEALEVDDEERVAIGCTEEDTAAARENDARADADGAREAAGVADELEQERADTDGTALMLRTPD